MLSNHHEQQQQLGALLQHQIEQQRRQREEAVAGASAVVKDFRLDALKAKDKTSESAVASPEVKRRLQEVILQRKRREAAASMGNLQTGIPGPVTPAPPNPSAILRKVQSESNLLKIKNRVRPSAGAAPYSRVFNNQLQLVPETSVVSGSEASTPSPISTSVSNGSVSANHQHQIQSSSSVESAASGSTPASPGSSKAAPQGGPLGASPLNSKSLPNIPSSLDKSRRSPPIRLPRRNPLEKSHSYAILPLRKHLMQKSMLERRSLDDNQYCYSDTGQHKPRLIRPLEEVMEEEQTSSSSFQAQPLGLSLVKNPSTEEMDTDTDSRYKPSSPPIAPNRSLPAGYFTPYVGIGPSGISPLVLSDPRVAVSISPDHVQHKLMKTGIGFHSAMLKHQCHCENTKNHPENPER